MAPQIVATTTADPDFYARKTQMLGQAIDSLRARADQRRQQKEQQDLAEVQRFFTAAEGMPELASTWGTQIKQKYGAKYPGVGEMVDAIAKRGEIPAMVAAKGQEFSSMVDAAEAERARRGQEIQAMPDTIQQQVAMPPQFGPFGAVGQALAPLGLASTPITVEAPNEEKQRVSQEYNSVDPQFLPWMVAQKMPFRDRAAAGIWAKQQGVQVPAPATFDPWGDDLPDSVKAQLAGDLGKLTGGANLATNVMNKLTPAPARLQEQGYQTRERKERDAFDRGERLETQDFQDAAREKSDRLTKERIQYQDRLSRARMERQAAIDTSLVDRRKTKDKEEDSAKGLGKALADDSSAAQKSYDKELNQALAGIVSPADIMTAKKEFVRGHGTRPAAISKLHARRIESSIRARIDAGEIDESDIEAEAEQATATYMAATGRGIAPSEALKVALGGEEGPEATKQGLRHSARQRIDEIRQGGDIESPSKDEEEPGEEDSGVALEAAPSPRPAQQVDRKRVEGIIRKAHPRWTDAQVRESVDAYVTAKDGG